MKSCEVTAERLRELLDYDPLTGVFTWRRAFKKQRIEVGDVAGTTSKRGYRLLTVDGTQVRANRAAWLHYYGKRPTHEVDHKNEIKSDNRIKNLRDVTGAINSQNHTVSWNKHGYRGVDFINGWYGAQIQTDGERVRLGWYRTAEEAGDAYLFAKALLHAEAMSGRMDQ